jgi:hypothetical protein
LDTLDSVALENSNPMDSAEESSGYDSRETTGLTRDASIYAAAAAAQQHYDALLAELQDGQRQVIAANGLCQKLRKDNLALSSNFDKVRLFTRVARPTVATPLLNSQLKAETLRLKQQLANARQDAARSEEARVRFTCAVHPSFFLAQFYCVSSAGSGAGIRTAHAIVEIGACPAPTGV